MTDTPAGSPAPKRTTTAKTTAAKTPTAKAPGAKAPATKAPAAKAPATKAPAAKAPAAKAPATKTTPGKAAAVPPVVPVVATPATVPAPVAATAPAGWYPVAAGSAQQRWWDGARWTEHVYEPPVTVAPAAPLAAGVPAAAVALRAPEGTRAGTAWFWLLAVGAPVLSMLALIPTAIFLSQIINGDATDPTAAAADIFSPASLIATLSGWFIAAFCVVFGALDWRELRHRGVPKPFHWAWGFFVILLGWPAVYVIGRAIVTKHRTGRGLAPLWVFIGLEVVTLVVTVIVYVSAFIQILGNLASVSANVL